MQSHLMLLGSVPLASRTSFGREYSRRKDQRIVLRNNRIDRPTTKKGKLEGEIPRAASFDERLSFFGGRFSHSTTGVLLRSKHR